MIAPVPLDAASFIADLSQPLGEVVDVGRARERDNGFDVGDAVESIEGRGEDFGGVGRANQRIWLVGKSEEVAGEKVNSASGGRIGFRFR